MALFLQLKTKKYIFRNMAILEKIASHSLSFEKMSLIDKEKLKIAEETHYKLQKTKGKLHTSLFTKMVGYRASVYQ